MKNINNLDMFVELSQNELLSVDGGDGFWSDVWQGIKDFFYGIKDGFNQWFIGD